MRASIRLETRNFIRSISTVVHAITELAFKYTVVISTLEAFCSTSEIPTVSPVLVRAIGTVAVSVTLPVGGQTGTHRTLKATITFFISTVDLVLPGRTVDLSVTAPRLLYTHRVTGKLCF